MKLPDRMTIGEAYGPAMNITDQTEADEYFAALVDHSMSKGLTRDEAIRVEKINLGYYAGYYDRETMSRVNKLFRTTHPVFGDTQPTVEEALETGRKMAGREEIDAKV